MESHERLPTTPVQTQMSMSRTWLNSGNKATIATHIVLNRTKELYI